MYTLKLYCNNTFKYPMKETFLLNIIFGEKNVNYIVLLIIITINIYYIFNFSDNMTVKNIFPVYRLIM